jgi:SAM-dependent methyltransferase
MVGDANAGQIEFWNSASGQKWIRFESLLDGAFEPVSLRIIDELHPTQGERCMDVGCGTGATTLLLANQVAAAGSVLAVDVSEQLLQRAEERAQSAGIDNVRFELCDAQTHVFDAGSLDCVASRFGVMFFDDPVAAFVNIKNALRPGGRIAFASWAALELNPWFCAPLQLAVERLGAPEPKDPNAPGPLAFRDISRVQGILGAAGFSDVSAIEESVPLKFPCTLDEAAELASNLGPASRLATEKSASEEDLAAISAGIRSHFADMVTEGGVEVPAKINFFTALAG